MVEMDFKVADVIFRSPVYFDYTYKLMKDYRYEGGESPRLIINYTLEDITEGARADNIYTAAYENLIILKRLSEFMLREMNGFMFHSSALAFNGNGVLFGAKSGTGKSTHSRMWRESFNDVVMVNDDKPIIRLVDGKFFVYGTPWRGKHRLGENVSAEVKAVCFIERAEQNFIEEINDWSFVTRFLAQTPRFDDVALAEKLLELVSELCSRVKTYVLHADISHEAAKICRRRIENDLNL